jgi:hypothetical protein
MSIIQEALKKAQTTYTEKTVKAAPPRRPDVAVEPAAQKSRRAATPLTKLMPGMILLILIAGFGLNSFFSRDPAGALKNGSRQNVSYKPVVKDAALKDSSDAGIGIRTEDIASPMKRAISPRAAFVHAPDLELNGIMYLEEKPRAIINGNMVEVGESVSGAKIDAITRNSVLLNYNDLEITLKLKE